MARMLILNCGVTNRGNSALVASTMQAITAFIPDAVFTLMGDEAGTQDGLAIQEPAARIASGPHLRPYRLLISSMYLVLCIFIHLLARLHIQYPISRCSRLFAYRDCDLVINSGGDQLSGERSFGLTTFMNVLYAILLDKRVVLYGESLGYFSNRVFNSMAKFVLNRTALILLREQLSKEYLDREGITRPRIFVTAEPAFLLAAASEERVRSILTYEGIGEMAGPLIGVNPSGMIMRTERTAAAMAQVVDSLVEDLSATVIMIPHVYTPSVDDRVTIETILSKIRNKDRVKAIWTEYTAGELKGIIGRCDIFIGARMHATIAATSMLVPTVGIAYSHKMHGIIGEMLGQDRYVLAIEELDFESLTSRIFDAWQNRERIRSELARTMPKLKEEALLNGKLVKELVDSLRIS